MEAKQSFRWHVMANEAKQSFRWHVMANEAEQSIRRHVHGGEALRRRGYPAKLMEAKPSADAVILRSSWRRSPKKH